MRGKESALQKVQQLKSQLKMRRVSRQPQKGNSEGSLPLFPTLSLSDLVQQSAFPHIFPPLPPIPWDLLDWASKLTKLVTTLFLWVHITSLKHFYSLHTLAIEKVHCSRYWTCLTSLLWTENVRTPIASRPVPSWSAFFKAQKLKPKRPEFRFSRSKLCSLTAVWFWAGVLGLAGIQVHFLHSSLYGSVLICGWNNIDSKSQNHRMAWFGREFKDQLVLTHLPWTGTSSIRPGCSNLHPIWP